MKNIFLITLFISCTWYGFAQNTVEERQTGQCVLLESGSSDLVYSCDNMREIDSENINIYRDRLVSYYSPKLVSIDVMSEENKIRISFKQGTSGSTIDEVFEHFNVKAK